MSNTIRELEEISELLSIAIAREQASIEFYTNAYRKAVFESARRTFSLVIEEEQRHELKLRDQLQELKSQIQLARSKGGKAQG